jgi:MFS transporter, DHA2 family, multidrug resistance protein
MFVSGIAMFLTAPFAGRLADKLDPRVMLMAGFIGFGSGTWLMTQMTAQWDFNELLVPQILRGVSLMICMVPISNVALGTLPPERMKNASGLFNLTRNLGGAVGLAIINTVLINRASMHYQRIAETVTWANRTALDQLSGMARNFAASGLDGTAAATAQLAGLAHRQASVLSFIDVFFLLSILFAGLALLAMLMKRPAPAAQGAPAH